MAASQELQSWLLRVGLAFVFSYATVSMLFEPSRFTTYLPSFVPESWAETICLPAFSVYEALLAAFFLAGRRLFVVSVLSALTLGGIIVFNLDSFEVLFRNVAIACAALALAMQARDADARHARSQPAIA